MAASRARHVATATRLRVSLPSPHPLTLATALQPDQLSSSAIARQDTFAGARHEFERFIKVSLLGTAGRPAPILILCSGG